MSKQQYDYSVLIGRFAPVHNGHLRNITQALEVSKDIIIVLGSANKALTFHDPFTYEDRDDYIKKCLPKADRDRVHIVSVEDTIYQNAEWVKSVQATVNSVVLDYYPGVAKDAKIAIIGHDKDDSSWYIQSFKNWKLIDPGSYIKERGGQHPVSATKIRELMFTGYLDYCESNVPPAMYEWLHRFVKGDTFKALKEEYDADYAYLPVAHKNMMDGLWPTNFYTADAVVVQSGHVLLVQRGRNPGKGLWAMPGGHVEANETALQAALRELEQETDIKVPKKVLLGSLIGEKLFDAPARSLRGKTRSPNCRTVTVSHCFKLNDEESLPRVKGRDDAAMAWWTTFSDFEQMGDQMFEDHADIIKYWLARIED